MYVDLCVLQFSQRIILMGRIEIGYDRVLIIRCVYLYSKIIMCVYVNTGSLVPGANIIILVC